MPMIQSCHSPRSIALLACLGLASAGCSADRNPRRAVDAAVATNSEAGGEDPGDDVPPELDDAGQPAGDDEVDASAEAGVEPSVDAAEAGADDAGAGSDAHSAGNGSETGDAQAPDGCRAPDVDLLFAIDNSGSMAEEQQKLARAVPELLGVLATGNHDGKRRADGEPTDFAPAHTIHVGVISTDLGVNLAPAIESCGGASYNPLAPDPANTNAQVRAMAPNGERIDKLFGDDGVLQISTAVAEAGIWARPTGTTFSTPVELVVQPDPACRDVHPAKRYLEYAPGDVLEDTQQAFSCIAKLGKNGCGLEQQLEAMLKAVSPASAQFSRHSGGQGTAPGANAGFLRDDAVLAVVIISDEDDCSIPDASSDIFNRNSSTFTPGDINTRCGKPANQHFLHPLSRYIDGLRALKSEAYRERIVVAAITGLPLAENLGGKVVHQGQAELAALLAAPEMQFITRPSNISTTDEEPVPACDSPRGDGSASPGRRLLELAQAFGDNGVATSICEDDYRASVERLGRRIAQQLGHCQ